MKRLLLVLLTLPLLGCPTVEKGMGQAMDNANSVIKTAPGTLWVPEGEESDEEQSQKAQQRY